MTTILLEGKEYQLDIEQAKKLGLLKNTNDRVKSWEEFGEKYHSKYGYFYEVNGNTFLRTTCPVSLSYQLTPHEAKAIAAFSKLLKLRRDWIGEWEPDWKNIEKCIVVIMLYNNVIVTSKTSAISHPLCFPNYELAQDFLETFRDLIEEAKTLI